MTAKILVSDPIAQDGIDMLRAHAEVDVKTGLKPEELLAIIGDYDGLAVRSETKVTAAVIAAGHKLQVIGRAGIGVDNIDLDAATQRGIVVVNAPTGNIVSAAEHTIALLLALARNIPQAHAHLKEGGWSRGRFTGVEVRGKALGIIGLGKVGSEVARRAVGLEMRVLAHDPFVSLEYARYLGAEVVPLERLLKESDFITVHTPLIDATRNLIGTKELALVKPAVRMINVARGGIIDEDALYQALEEGRVAGVALDVFQQEPPPKDLSLLKSDKVIATPHLGASTAEAQVSVAVDIAEQILAVLRGEPARYAVNAPLIPPETYSTVGPYLGVARQVAQLVAQLAEGQPSSINITFEGEIANYDLTALKAAVIGGLLESISEERVSLVNANLIAESRGLRIVEKKSTKCENYGNLITIEAITSQGQTQVAGTLMRGETHIVLVDRYWVDLVPTGGYWLFSDHQDRPGLIGAVGNITGNADINISSMLVSRLAPRGRALMMLGLDEPIGEAQIAQILAIPNVYTAKLVKL